MSLIGSFTSDVLAKSMDGHFARQTAIAGNLANAETPGYHRRDVQFGEALNQAIEHHRTELAANDTPLLAPQQPWDASRLQASNPLHFGFWDNQQQGVRDIAIEPTEDTAHQTRVDQNGVDVETEMVRLAQNASRFKALTVLQGRWNQQIKGVINSNG